MLTILCWLLAAFSIACLASTLLIVRWTLKQSSLLRSEAQKDLVATTSVISGMLTTTTESLLQHQAKSLGAVTALVRETTSGLSSITATLTAENSRLTSLVAAKEPMAYSQLEQTRVALAPTDGTDEPYPAVDDAERERVRQEFLQQSDEMQAYLTSQGISIEE